MKIITASDCTIIVDDRDRSPMDLYGGKAEHDLETIAMEHSANGKTVHVVRPAFDWDGNFLFFYRVASYVNGQCSDAFNSLVRIEVPEIK